MAETWYPKAKRLPITTQEYTKQRGMPILAICDHITAGSDSRGWLQHANNGSSVHFLIRVENGQGVVYQFMPIEWMAWGNGRHSGVGNPYMPEWVRAQIMRGVNPNQFTISIEHEGVTPTPALYTGPMLEASIELHKWLDSVVPTLTADREHVIGHYQIDHLQRPNCPGGPGGAYFPFTRIIAEMKGMPPDQHTFPETGFTVKGKFWQEWQRGGLHVNGYPISDAYGDGGVIRQWFENARMRLGTDGVVRYDAIGRELKESN